MSKKTVGSLFLIVAAYLWALPVRAEESALHCISSDGHYALDFTQSGNRTVQLELNNQPAPLGLLVCSRPIGQGATLDCQTRLGAHNVGCHAILRSEENGYQVYLSKIRVGGEDAEAVLGCN